MPDDPIVRKNGLYFEDLSVGDRYETPGVTLTESAIIDFAMVWDPQPFHIDKRAAEQSVFGKLVASGLQTVLLTSRLFVETGMIQGTAIAGLGFDETRFHKPLFPDDTIRVIVSVAEKAETRRPGAGRVVLKMETLNQHDDCIYSTRLNALIARRGAAG